MATRKKTRGPSGNADRASQAMRDSAQKIWLAGLGAVERAKTEGPRMFETLVEQGRSLGTRAREGADQALRAMREGAATGGARWDKLEQVFEDRVAKSLGRLGVITGREVDQLSRQVQELNDSVRRMMSSGGAKPAGRKAGAAKRKSKSKAKAKAGTRKARPRKAKASRG